MASVLGGLRNDPDAAIRLLEKGAPNSDYWRIHFLLGFQYFMEKGDYVTRREHLERAFELGGPPYLQFLISRLYAQRAAIPTTAMQFIARAPAERGDARDPRAARAALRRPLDQPRPRA